MKKILTLALCLTAVGSMSAQKENVDQAAKMSGKIDKIADARALINQAKENPATANDVRTYYVAGKLEFDAFDEAFKKRAINPDDPAVNTLDMGTELINGYNEFLKALPLDSVPNEKGQIKPKHSKDMVSKINGHHNDYFNYGGEMFNNKHYYPEAYNAFMIYGDIPSQPWADKAVKAVPDSMVALAYHYAGIGAFSGNDLNAALKAFEKARNAGITDPQNYVYEIACWQNLVLRDSTLENKAKTEIENVARDGYEKFGISNPLFINNLVNSLLQQSRYDDVVALIGNQLDKTPDQAFLYGLRGYVYDRKGDDEASLADYRKAASIETADIETLKNAAKKIYTTGTEKWNAIEGNQPEARNDVKVNYFEAAKAIAERAQQMDPADSDVQYILENINYALETYF
jgi:tetratricopeptide (TPR) repeat protein